MTPKAMVETTVGSQPIEILKTRPISLEPKANEIEIINQAEKRG